MSEAIIEQLKRIMFIEDRFSFYWTMQELLFI